MRALLIENRRRVSRAAQKRRKRILFVAAFFLIAAAFLFFLLVYLSHNSEFLVQRIDVEGSALVSKTELTARVENILGGSYILLFPKSNSLLLPKSEIMNTVLAEYPALDSVSIRRTSFSSILVSVHEREPSVLWCESDSQSEAGFSGCYFVDKDGFIFAKAPDISSNVYFRFVGSYASSTIGTALFPPERFREFSFFIQSLRDLGLSPIRVVISEGAAGIPDFSIELASGVKLLVSGAHSFEQTLADITAFFSDPEISTSSAKFLERVAYVDFRFGSKVFYKLRGE